MRQERPVSYAVDVVEPGRTVVARSSRRLPFEPSGSLREFRSELASACRTLDAQAHETLHAVYTSPQRDAVDLENVLTYNLGTGALTAAARHALVLVRSFDATGDRDHEHHYRYELTADVSPTVATLTSATPLADIELVAAGPRDSDGKPTDDDDPLPGVVEAAEARRQRAVARAEDPIHVG